MPKRKAKSVTVVDNTDEPVVANNKPELFKIKTLPEPIYVGTLGVLLHELISRHGPIKLEITYATGSRFSYIVEKAFDEYVICKGQIILSLQNAAYFRIPDKEVLQTLQELTSDE